MSGFIRVNLYGLTVICLPDTKGMEPYKDDFKKLMAEDGGFIVVTPAKFMSLMSALQGQFAE